MVPSLLPAFSAPQGVSAVPSCLASSALMAASALPQARTLRLRARCKCFFMDVVSGMVQKE